MAERRRGNWGFEPRFQERFDEICEKYELRDGDAAGEVGGSSAMGGGRDLKKIPWVWLKTWPFPQFGPAFPGGILMNFAYRYCWPEKFWLTAWC